MEPGKSSPERLELEYSITPEDVLAFRPLLLARQARPPLTPQQERRIAAIALPVIGCFLAIVVISSREALPDVKWWLLAIPFIAIGPILLFKRAIWGDRETQRRRQAARIRLSVSELAMIGPHRLTLSEKGLELRGPHTSVFHDAAGFVGIERLEGMNAIRFATGAAVLIPIRVFNTEQGADALLSRAELVLDAGKRSSPSFESALVRNAPVQCPKCGYALHGTGSTRCPECGVEVTLDRLARKFGV